MEKNSDHIEIINSLRGIAATMVCFYHFVNTTVDFIETEWILEIFKYGKKGVHLFFIISGIVIPLSMIKSNYNFKNFGAFLIKRFVRIEPPYIIAVILGILYLIARNHIPGTATVDLTPSFTEIILHLGYLIPFFEDMNWVNPVFWTLAVEFQYYLILAISFPLVISKKIPFGRFGFYLIFISLGFLNISSSFFPYWAPYFLMGILYIIWRKEIITTLEFMIVFAITGATVLYLLGATDLIVAILALLSIHYFTSFKTKLTLFLGKISYSLYLLHSLVGAAIINYLSHHVETGALKFVVIIIGFSASLFASYLLYRFVEKPTHKYAKSIGKS